MTFADQNEDEGKMGGKETTKRWQVFTFLHARLHFLKLVDSSHERHVFPLEDLDHPLTMEAVAAFGLACGIIQIIDFSTKVVKKCREIYRDGALSDNDEVEVWARNLLNIRSDLDLEGNHGEDDLLDLGSKCASTAEELVAELEDLKVDSPHRKREAIRKTIMTVTKKKRIQSIEKRLKGYTKILESRILVDLRSV